jgi:hypothetical protein
MPILKEKLLVIASFLSVRLSAYFLRGPRPRRLSELLGSYGRAGEAVDGPCDRRARRGPPPVLRAARRRGEHRGSNALAAPSRARAEHACASACLRRAAHARGIRADGQRTKLSGRLRRREAMGSDHPAVARRWPDRYGGSRGSEAPPRSRGEPAGPTEGAKGATCVKPCVGTSSSLLDRRPRATDHRRAWPPARRLSRPRDRLARHRADHWGQGITPGTATRS